jgi:hypothetical protein
MDGLVIGIRNIEWLFARGFRPTQQRLAILVFRPIVLYGL